MQASLGVDQSVLSIPSLQKRMTILSCASCGDDGRINEVFGVKCYITFLTKNLCIGFFFKRRALLKLIVPYILRYIEMKQEAFPPLTS